MPRTNTNKSESGTTDIRALPLSLIDDDERFRLREAELPNVDDLATNIAKHGQTTPAFVVPAKDGRFALVSGYRRRAAVVSLGRTTILARVFSGLSETEALELAVSENAQRDDLNDWEKASVCGRLKARGRTKAEIAAQFGFTERTAGRYLAIAEFATEPLKDALRKGALPLFHAMIIAERILAPSSPIDEDEAVGIISEAIAGSWSRRVLEQKIRALTTSPSSAETKKKSTAQINRSPGGTFNLRLSFKPGLHDFAEAMQTLKNATDEIRRLKKVHDRAEKNKAAETRAALRRRIEDERRAAITRANREAARERSRLRPSQHVDRRADDRPQSKATRPLLRASRGDSQ